MCVSVENAHLCIKRYTIDTSARERVCVCVRLRVHVYLHARVRLHALLLLYHLEQA